MSNYPAPRLAERVFLAKAAMRGIREHSWVMGGDTALCRYCLRVVDVVPINAAGDWNAGTVFCSETRERKRSRLIATMSRIASATLAGSPAR